MSNALKFLEKENGPTTFGMLIRAYRTRNDLTQEQVADLLGIGKNQVSDIENDRKSISIGKCVEYAKKLGESIIVFTKVWLEQNLREEEVNVSVDVKILSPSQILNKYGTVRAPIYRDGMGSPSHRMAARKASKKTVHTTRKKVFARKAH